MLTTMQVKPIAWISSCVVVINICLFCVSRSDYASRQLSLSSFVDPKTVLLRSTPRHDDPNNASCSKVPSKLFVQPFTGMFDPTACTSALPDKNLLHFLFPKYNGELHTGLCNQPLEKAASENDVLLAQLNAHGAHVLDDIMQFPGRIVFINPGVFDLHPSVAKAVDHFDFLPSRSSNNTGFPPIVVLGPHEDSTSSVRVFLMAILLLRQEPNPEATRAKIFQHHLKPINTGTHFMLYAVSHCVLARERAAHAIATTVGPIHVAGKCQGNPEGISLIEGSNIHYERAFGVKCDCQPWEPGTNDHVVVLQENGTWRSNDVLMHDYRFALVMESSSLREGYLTEKIMNAFLAGTIPVYHGSRDVFDVFNPAAFIFLDPENMDPALRQIAYLEQNRTAYNEMLFHQSILKDGMETVNKYFSLSDEIGDGSLKRKIREKLGFKDDC